MHTMYHNQYATCIWQMQDTAEPTEQGSMVAEAEAQALNKNDILIILQSSDVTTCRDMRLVIKFIPSSV